MKSYLLLFFSWISLTQVLAQPADQCPNGKNAGTYFNGFQHTRSDPAKTTQAFSYAQALARECPATLQSLFHNHFAQAFSPHIRGNRDNSTEKRLLDLCITDTNQVLGQTAKPIYLWVQVQENIGNSAELIKLTNTFVDTQFTTADLYANRTARYALLIYRLIRNNEACSQAAQHLFTRTSSALSSQIKKYELPGDVAHTYKRAWYRYLYGYMHALEAEAAQQRGDLVNAEKFYRMASVYSPDETDKGVLPAYEYDKVFLQGKDSYHEDYLAILTSHPDRSRSLETLTRLAIQEPTHIFRLQAFYKEHYPASEPYATYWARELNKHLKPAPDFTLQLINNQTFSLSEQKGKWVLLDFWGTWCAPCIEEMPHMQTFYREIQTNYAGKLSLITIACKDTPAKVQTFLSKHRYTFPVAMASADIEDAFAITAYPTKLLVTPQGNILPIQSDGNWVDRVKLYIQSE